MTIEELAKQLGLPVLKVRKTVKKLFGDIDELTGEQIRQLKNSISDFGDLAQLPPDERKEELAQLEQSDPELAEVGKVLYSCIGITNLKKSREIYLDTLANIVIELKQASNLAAQAIIHNGLKDVHDAINYVSSSFVAVQQEWNLNTFKSAMSADELHTIDIDFLRAELDLAE